MIELNLIRKRTRKTGGADRYLLPVWGLCLVSAGILVLLVIRAAGVHRAVSVHEKTLADFRQDILKNKKLLGVQDLLREWAQYQAQLDAVERLMDSRTDWTALLNELSTSLPPTVYFNHVALETVGQKRMLLLTATAVAGDKKPFDQINDYITGLSQNALFARGINILSHESVNDKGASGESFRIEIPIKDKEEDGEKEKETGTKKEKKKRAP